MIINNNIEYAHCPRCNGNWEECVRHGNISDFQCEDCLMRAYTIPNSQHKDEVRVNYDFALCMDKFEIVWFDKVLDENKQCGIFCKNFTKYIPKIRFDITDEQFKSYILFS